MKEYRKASIAEAGLMPDRGRPYLATVPAALAAGLTAGVEVHLDEVLGGREGLLHRGVDQLVLRPRNCTLQSTALTTIYYTLGYTALHCTAPE